MSTSIVALFAVRSRSRSPGFSRFVAGPHPLLPRRDRSWRTRRSTILGIGDLLVVVEHELTAPPRSTGEGCVRRSVPTRAHVEPVRAIICRSRPLPQFQKPVPVVVETDCS